LTVRFGVRQNLGIIAEFLRARGTSAGLKTIRATRQTAKPTVTGRKLVWATKSFGNELYLKPNLFRGRDPNFAVNTAGIKGNEGGETPNENSPLMASCC